MLGAAGARAQPKLVPLSPHQQMSKVAGSSCLELKDLLQHGDLVW